MKILGLDPGPEKSAWVLYDPDIGIIDKDITPSCILSGMIYLYGSRIKKLDEVVVESIESYGMAVGKSIFETCYYIGEYRAALKYSRRVVPLISASSARIIAKESAFKHFHLLSRRAVKLHLCNSMRAKDSNVRQVLIDRFPTTGKDSKGKPSAIGTKKYPGPLYGIKKDMWSALALAVYYAEQQEKKDGR